VLAANLFEGKSFNGLTLAVAVLALLVAVVGAYYARGALFPPKRRLTINIPPPVRLLAHAATQVTDLQVSRDGRVLPDPYVVTLEIRNTGRHAIGSDQYDQGRPIEFDLESPVEAVLTPTESTATATLAVKGSCVRYGPDLIRRKQKIVIQVLTSGRPSSEYHPVQYLIDTEVSLIQGEYDPPFKFAARAAVTVLVPAIASILAALVNILTA
jgi:hypothetical protein